MCRWLVSDDLLHLKPSSRNVLCNLPEDCTITCTEKDIYQCIVDEAIASGRALNRKAMDSYRDADDSRQFTIHFKDAGRFLLENFKEERLAAQRYGMPAMEQCAKRYTVKGHSLS